MIAAALVLLAPQATGEEPTFNRDVAPILREHCAPCHRPGESGPFPLLSYSDARKRAGQLVEVTGSGFMPPWLPESSAYPFANDRRLTAAEVATLAAWAAADSPEGDATDLAPEPEWPQGWRLGAPDLVLELDVPFELDADGSDEFRNLVFANPLGETRYVRAVELRPGNPAVHHAIVQVDETPSCRVLDEVDDAPGFPGMRMGESEPPDGHFIAWTPGKLPRPMPADMAWRLRPGADLVVQLHLAKTGKREQLRPRIGLYFTDRAPTRFPYSLVLYREDIEIPAGEVAHTIRDEVVLPVDALAFAVYPHAHYLGRRVRATVERPDGSREELLRIEDWDFNWQDEYQFAEPVPLPAGSVLAMEWTYDNSSGNPRNPNAPPLPVTFGESSGDEMGTLTLAVLPLHPAGRHALERARWQAAVRRKPYDWVAHNMLAVLAIEEGDHARAAGHLDQALAYNPEYPDALANAGLLLLAQGRGAPALEMFDRALELESAHPLANAKRGVALRTLGRTEEARSHFERALARWPHLAETRFELANLLALAGQDHAAIEHYREALRLTPDLPEAHNNLANTYFAIGAYDLATQSYERALALRPAYFNARYNLGRCLLELRLYEQAAQALVEATRLAPEHPGAAAALREALLGTRDATEEQR